MEHPYKGQRGLSDVQKYKTLMNELYGLFYTIYLFGLRTYLPGIESVDPGDEQLQHSHCTGLC